MQLSKNPTPAEVYAWYHANKAVIDTDLHYAKVRAFTVPLWKRILQWFGIK